MGQYYYVVNLDKKEFLYPHKLGDGLKLWEMAASGGCGRALIPLLSDGNGRGGGDFEEHPLVGSWAGDRIVISGDYSDEGNFLEKRKLTAKEVNILVDKGYNRDKSIYNTDFNLHTFAGIFYKDISLELRELLINEGIKLNKRWDDR